MSETVTFRVPEELGGERIDRVVAVAAQVSRAQAKRMVGAGEVTVDDHRVAASHRVKVGDGIHVVMPTPVAELTPAEIDFSIAWEDSSLLVVDKPPGLVVHPGAGHRDDTLVNGLIARYPALVALGPELRWGLVHRLDRDTSGLLMVAKHPDAYRSLQQALKGRRVGRTYLGMAVGTFDAGTGTIDAPIGRDPVHPTRMAVHRDGRPARTHYRRLAEWSGVTLLEVRLETGRTHQIRVHLASIDRPISGDRVYGRPGPVAADPGRTWLHASALSLPHPDDGREVVVSAPLPSDLAATFGALGIPGSGEIPGNVSGR
jgi:23S rRNA pseudouridine1911/1915/1917 synthase